ncbi:MAG: hypothetical protein ACRYGM_12670, partial [Janthinobacterium lividum]
MLPEGGSRAGAVAAEAVGPVNQQQRPEARCDALHQPGPAVGIADERIAAELHERDPGPGVGHPGQD